MRIDRATARPLLILGFLVVVSITLFLFMQQSGFIAYVSDADAVQRSVQSLGALGPAILIGLMTIAIVASPIPSAPIGLAAGAAYGPVFGSVITITGSALGSIVAFGIARFLAYDTVRRWSAVRKPLDWLGKERSQTWLMVVVFVSRLVPFVSFDAVSYAAGLTPLAFWRFALATIAGVAPISFALAFGGDALLASGGGDITFWLLVAGGITVIPVVLKLVWDQLKGAKRHRDSN
jgi:uncharacterized membrane protein YdjX (TVP38/TMEM64 family)